MGRRLDCELQSIKIHKGTLGIEMLIIRKEQMEVFRRYMLERFVDQAVIHLRTILSDITANLSETNLRKVIYKGIEIAAEYNIRFEHEVLRVVEYVAKYEEHFDTTGKTCRAIEILKMEGMDSSFKLEQLDEFFNSVSGEDA